SLRRGSRLMRTPPRFVLLAIAVFLTAMRPGSSRAGESDSLIAPPNGALRPIPYPANVASPAPTPIPQPKAHPPPVRGPSSIVSNPVTGNWSSPGTWAGGVLPTANDDVVIADGATITIDTSVMVNGLTVGQGTSGALLFDFASPRALTVAGDVTVS